MSQDHLNAFGYILKGHGWECPKCGRVWSPDAEECKECNEKRPEN